MSEYFGQDHLSKSSFFDEHDDRQTGNKLLGSYEGAPCHIEKIEIHSLDALLHNDCT